MKVLDVLSLSYRTVKGNKLRTGITVAIIAFGIMALIGIITAIEAMNQSLRENFTMLGANAFSIRFKERNIRIGHDQQSDVKKSKRGAKRDKASNMGKVISMDQATLFKDSFNFPSTIGLQLGGPRDVIVKYANKETNPNIRMVFVNRST
jgi:putative ABC transport system permease protein